MYKGGVRVRGERTHRPLTKIEKTEICRRTLAGEKQVALAIEFGCHPSAIRRACARGGIRRWPSLTPELEQQAVRLAHEGVAVYRIAKATRLRGRDVREVMRKHHIIHKVGGGPKLPARKMNRIVEAVTNHEDHMYLLAKKLGVDRSTVRRVARAVLGVDGFVGYPNIYPLTSKVAVSDAHVETSFQKFAENLTRKTISLETNVETLTKQMNGLFLTMVQKHIDLWHSGVVPADRNSFIEEIVEINLPRSLRGKGPLTEAQWDQHRTMLKGYVRTALEAVATQGTVN